VKSRSLLFVILIYVGLDLSIATLPGAFEFEPSKSVECLRDARGGVDFIPMPALAVDSMLLPQSRVAVVEQPAPTCEHARCVEPVIVHRPRTRLVPAPSSDDPH